MLYAAFKKRNNKNLMDRIISRVLRSKYVHVELVIEERRYCFAARGRKGYCGYEYIDLSDYDIFTMPFLDENKVKRHCDRHNGEMYRYFEAVFWGIKGVRMKGWNCLEIFNHVTELYPDNLKVKPELLIKKIIENGGKLV